MKRIAALLLFILAAVMAGPAQASLDDQFACRSVDHASLLVSITAFATDKAVLQAVEKEGGEAHVHGLAMKPGGNWQDFRYEDSEGHVFAGGNGKAVLLMHGASYFCEYSGDPSEEGSGDEARVSLLLGGEGLEIRRTDGSDPETLMFGDKKADVVAALWMVFGAPGEASQNAECGAGPMSFQRFGSFTANFSENDWVGWSLDNGRGSPAVSVKLANGAQIGSPVLALPGKLEWFRDSTLGDEFTAGGVSGLAAGKGKDAPVDALWAGINCHFR